MNKTTVKHVAITLAILAGYEFVVQPWILKLKNRSV